MLSNISLTEGIFPECFKTAKIIQNFKSGDSNSTLNYRPISMSFLAKNFEKFMCARLDSYLKPINNLSTNQFGFQKNSNTSDTIIEFLDYVYSSFDSMQRTIAVYLGFLNAFDAVNDNILMGKLLHNGIRGVTQSWFKSYLSNRKHHVLINSAVLPSQTLHYG